jgi:hypothetical protein
MESVSPAVVPPVILKDALHCDHPRDITSANVKVNKIRFILFFNLISNPYTGLVCDLLDTSEINF